MKANIVKFDADEYSNGGASMIVLCIDHDIHLQVRESWHEEWGGDPEDVNDAHNCWDQVSYSTELGPCDCGFGPSVELTAEHKAMIEAYNGRGHAGVDPRLSLTEDRRGKKEEGTPHSYSYKRYETFSIE